MTKITIDRAVVEQALHVATAAGYPLALIAALRAALEQQDERDWSLLEATQESLREHMAEIHRLRAALAQRAEPVTEDMKSAVRWAPSSAYWSERLREFFGPDAREGIAALERRLAEAQQAEPVEPAAWHYTNNGGGNVMHWGPSARLDADIQAAKDYPRAHKVTPLYTAPPQRKPLTDEEIHHATRHCGVSKYTATNIARAVEEASWEKNYG